MKYTPEELAAILARHAEWLTNERLGVRASLYGADLSGMSLRGVNLRRANLCGAKFDGCDLIGADFSGPGEGRGYSQARTLREQWKFGGELRATGYVRRDQLLFMARCGFNSFELPDTDIESAQAALGTFSWAYQPSNDTGLPLKLRRR